MLFARRFSHLNGTYRLDYLDVRWIPNQKTWRRFSSENREDSGKFVKVATTGYSYLDRRTGERVAKYGIYWGADDARNGIRTLPAGQTSHITAMLTAILEACHVAREEDPPPSLLIYSDLTSSDTLLKDLTVWAKRDFYTRNHEEKLRNADILKDLFLAVQGLHLRIAFQPSRVDGDKTTNRVTAAILADAERQARRIAENVETEGSARYCRLENVAEPVARIEMLVGTVLDKSGKVIESAKSEQWPKVYVAARTKNKEGFISAGYCTHWPGGESGGGHSFRFAPYPITLFRAELAAIEEALKQAVDSRTIQKLCVSVPSAHFMNAWRRRWCRDDGTSRYFTGKAFFDRISDLCDRLDEVHFKYERVGERTEIGRELEKKCAEGMGYAVVGKDTSEYRLEMEQLVRSKEQRVSGVPVVHLFKTGTPFNAGFVWSQSEEKEEGEGVSMCGTPSTLIRILEEAVRRREPTIVIRADSRKLIRSFEANLEVWRRNGWRNSLHKRIGKADEWERAWELKQKVRVLWELMEPVEHEDRDANARIPEWQRQEEADRK